MPMNPATLAADLRAAMLGGNMQAVDNDSLTNFCTTLAEVVVAHIQANASVTVVGTAATAPAPVAVNGTGTIA